MDSRYEIQKEVGQGGVGVVYEAWDRQLSRQVAIKRLLPIDDDAEKEAREKNQSAVNDLLREASILSAMQHPNIIAVFDAGLDDEGAYVVMELINGEVLRDAVERGPMVEEDFVEVVEQTMDALISAHHHGLLHRDIKPRNLMFRWLPSEKFQVKLLDFGLAKFSTKPEKQTQAYEDTIMGTSAYMAPEQFEHQELDVRTDLYQLGCVFYYTLTGTLPFDGDTPADIMESHLQHRVTPLGDMRTDLKPALAEWVMSLIERQPNDRPTTAKIALRTFRHALDPNRLQAEDDTASVVIGGTSAEPTAPQFMAPGDEDLPSNHAKKWLSVTAILAALGIGAYILTLPPKDSEPSTQVLPASEPPAPDSPAPDSVVPNEVEEPAPVSVTTNDAEDPSPAAETTDAEEPAPAIPVLLASDQEAIASHLDQMATVKGTVTGTGQSRSGTSFLNFEDRHFFVVSFPSVRHFFRLDPSTLYDQKEIEITGTILAYEGRYQIKLEHPDQVKVIE